jgi:hypothetical protein
MFNRLIQGTIRATKGAARYVYNVTPVSTGQPQNSASVIPQAIDNETLEKDTKVFQQSLLPEKTIAEIENDNKILQDCAILYSNSFSDKPTDGEWTEILEDPEGLIAYLTEVNQLKNDLVTRSNKIKTTEIKDHLAKDYIEHCAKRSAELQNYILQFVQRFIDEEIVNPYLEANTSLNVLEKHIYKGMLFNELSTNEVISQKNLQKLLLDLDNACTKRLKNYDQFKKLKNLIKNKNDQFDEENKITLSQMIGIGEAEYVKGTAGQLPKEGFHWLNNQIEHAEKTLQKKNEIQHISSDLSAHLELASQELQENYHYYNFEKLTGLKDVTDQKQKNLNATWNSTCQLIKSAGKSIDSSDENEISNLNQISNKVKHTVDMHMVTGKNIYLVGHYAKITDGSVLKALIGSLRSEDSYNDLMRYKEKTSEGKQAAFFEFEKALDEAVNLDELLTLIVKDHGKNSNKKNNNKDIYNNMTSNTGCGFYTIFNFFQYRSTTDKYLAHVAKDFKKILDKHFRVDHPKKSTSCCIP